MCGEIPAGQVLTASVHVRYPLPIGTHRNVTRRSPLGSAAGSVSFVRSRIGAVVCCAPAGKLNERYCSAPARASEPKIGRGLEFICVSPTFYSRRYARETAASRRGNLHIHSECSHRCGEVIRNSAYSQGPLSLRIVDALPKLERPSLRSLRVVGYNRLPEDA